MFGFLTPGKELLALDGRYGKNWGGYWHAALCVEQCGLHYHLILTTQKPMSV